MKICSRCHIEKESTEFWRAKTKDGSQSYCKLCAKEKGTEWRRRHNIKRRGKKEVYIVPESKICSNCQERKPRADFRTRWERRASPAFPYLNNTCKKCDALIALENYKKRKQTQEGWKKNQAWARAAYYRRREKAIAHMKKKRQTPEYKKMMRDYRERNKEKIYEQETITKRRYHEKNRDSLTDQYIISKIISQCMTTKEYLLKHPELIQAKRLQLLIKREIKNNGN